MFWIIFLWLILFLVGWILIAPIYLSIVWNDRCQQFQFRWLGIIRVRLVPVEEEWQLQLRIFFFKKEWPVMDLVTASAGATTPRPKTQKTRGWKPKHPIRMVIHLLRSFRIIRFRVHLDTDDYVVNAWLFPFFHLAAEMGIRDWRINFTGKSDWCIIIRNRLYKLVYAIFADQFILNQIQLPWKSNLRK